jgi:hypothetical protein
LTLPKPLPLKPRRHGLAVAAGRTSLLAIRCVVVLRQACNMAL